MVVIIRGIPGSGKSTTAKRMLKELGPDTVWCEADHYMLDEKGNYNFSPKKLYECHRKCFDKFQKAVDLGKNVIVSNTFTTKREVRPYIEYALEKGVVIEIIHAKGNYKSVHGVPDEKVQLMKDREEHYTVLDFAG